MTEKKYVIKNSKNLFWNNCSGYGCLATATLFTESDRLHLSLPMNGTWEQYKPQLKLNNYNLPETKE